MRRSKKNFPYFFNRKLCQNRLSSPIVPKRVNKLYKQKKNTQIQQLSSIAIAKKKKKTKAILPRGYLHDSSWLSIILLFTKGNVIPHQFQNLRAHPQFTILIIGWKQEMKNRNETNENGQATLKNTKIISYCSFSRYSCVFAMRDSCTDWTRPGPVVVTPLFSCACLSKSPTYANSVALEFILVNSIHLLKIEG